MLHKRITLGQIQEMLQDFLDTQDRHRRLEQDIAELKATETQVFNETRDKGRALKDALRLDPGETRVITVRPWFHGAQTVAIIRQPMDRVKMLDITVTNIIDPTPKD